ncbi:MAG: hypothetical protein KDC38_06700, partial [Planctomycetes bacterium]|nr:hypothetical protein [Planctomycetota bacterium]
MRRYPRWSVWSAFAGAGLVLLGVLVVVGFTKIQQTRDARAAERCRFRELCADVAHRIESRGWRVLAIALGGSRFGSAADPTETEALETSLEQLTRAASPFSTTTMRDRVRSVTELEGAARSSIIAGDAPTATRLLSSPEYAGSVAAALSSLDQLQHSVESVMSIRAAQSRERGYWVIAAICALIVAVGGAGLLALPRLSNAWNDKESRLVAESCANRNKTEFLANMSHELRTPLTAILGFAEDLAEHPTSSAEHSDAIETIRSNGRHLLQLVSDILDLSKIESGQLEIERAPVSVVELLREIRDLMEPRALRKGLRLVVEIDGEVPHSILSDRVRLRQILVNLIGNAVKFTAGGEVRITAALLDRHPPSSPASLVFSVSDTGIGLTAEQIDRIFE